MGRGTAWGGITIRAITVDAGIEAAVPYGLMHADDRTNGEQRRVWAGGEGRIEELDVPEADLARISPATCIERIVAPVSIHHREDDGSVPVEWSVELCERYVAFSDRHLKPSDEP